MEAEQTKRLRVIVDVFPGNFTNCPPNCGWCYTILVCQYAIRNTGGCCMSKLYNFCFGQFGCMYCFAKYSLAMPTFIIFVLGWRSPAKILQRIIEFVTIKMTALATFWARTTKSLQHQAVNTTQIKFSVFVKSSNVVTMWIQVIFEPMPCVRAVAFVTDNPTTPNRSVFSDAVIGKTRNWAILNICGKISFRHDSIPFNRVVLGAGRAHHSSMPRIIPHLLRIVNASLQR